MRKVARSRRHYYSSSSTRVSIYLRMAEKSVEQLIWQPCECLRSNASHTVKPIKTTTVTTSLARMLSFTIPRPQHAFTIENIAVQDRPTVLHRLGCFWIHGLNLGYAKVAAAVIFLTAVAAFGYHLWWETKRDKREP